MRRPIFALALGVVLVLLGNGIAAGSPHRVQEPQPAPGAGPILGALFPPTVEGAIHESFSAAGSHEVVTSQQLTPCNDLYGGLQKLLSPLAGMKDPEQLRCTAAFPHGLDSPVGVLYYYPKDLHQIAPAPTLVWVPGLDGDAGQYDAAARLWASRGFVVAIPYNFINSTATEHLWGIQALIHEEGLTASPLHEGIDFSRVILGGHSGGAGSLIYAASYLPPVQQMLDPRLHIVGALSVNTGIQAPIGAAITVPTLTITGTRDWITPPFLWPYWAYATTNQAPAYSAPVVNGTHLTINEDLPNNPAASLSMAWLEHLAGANPDADAVFVGPRWGLATDSAFVDVKRNAAAAQLK